MDNKKIYDELIEILLKKARGYYYTEEQDEYEKTQKEINNNINMTKNISFFDNFDTVEIKNNIANDKIKSSNGRQKNKSANIQNLTLVKKKVATHYIPPDMLAIKILFENIRKEVDGDEIENMSDEDLLKFKEKIIGEILNETK